VAVAQPCAAVVRGGSAVWQRHSRGAVTRAARRARSAAACGAGGAPRQGAQGRKRHGVARWGQGRMSRVVAWA